MNGFPVLRTGAVTQYPAERSGRFSTQVVRFLDGSEQRFREYAAPIRRWVVRLDALDERELNGLREFFRVQNGAAGTFSFADPWDGTEYPDCSLETDEMVETLAQEMHGGTALVVKENTR